MSEHISNLLIGTGTTVNSDAYEVVRYATTEPLVVGTTYTISAYVEELECDVKTPKLNIFDGAGWGRQAFLMGDTPSIMHTTFTYHNAYPDHVDPNYIVFYNTIPDSDAKRKAVLHHVMLVKGTEPAAWAPAEGEKLTADAGGGADAMSSNLLNGITPELRNGATKDGDVYIIPKKIDDSEHIDHIVYQLSIPKLESNRAFHIGFSRKAVSTSTDGIRASIKYIDDAGNINYMSLIDCDNTKRSWTWTSGSKTIPSGMTPVTLYISSLGETYGMRITNLTLSYDSPVVRAMSEMTATDVKDGMSSFLHIAYANSNDGQIGFSHTWSKSKTWIGHYVTDTNEADSDDPSKYTWIKCVGDDGIGIQEIIEYYNVSTSNTDVPTRWSTTVQPLDPVNRYLWNYEEVRFTSGDSHNTSPRVIGVYGDSVSKITPYYYLSNSHDTFTLVDGHEWSKTIPNISDGEYLWEMMIVTFSDGSTKETEPVLHGEYNALSEGMNIVSSNVDSQIEKAQDYILQTVDSSYATKDALNEYKSSIKTQFGVYDGKISANISKLNSVESGLLNLEETADNVNSYMTFDTAGLTLGKSDSDFKTTITNEKMSFTQNGNEVAYFANNQMYVTDGNFANSMTIGKFAFVPRANGSLDFKKVGK